MALAFVATKGKAGTNKVDAFEYKDGENVVRIFGGVLPRYVYWLKGTNGKDIPVECLAFNRDKEKFDNAEVDHVTEYYPDKKCSWAYSVNCIDIKNGKVVALNLKKKLFEQIISLAGDLESDPTDPDTGFDIVFKRTKTGPLPFNVEYTLSQIKSKKRSLNDAEREMIAASKDIDSKFPRSTADEVRASLEKILNGPIPEEEVPTGTDSEAIKDLA